MGGGDFGVAGRMGTLGIDSLLTVMEHVTLPNRRCRFKLPQEVIFLMYCAGWMSVLPPGCGKHHNKSLFKQSNGIYTFKVFPCIYTLNKVNYINIHSMIYKTSI